MNKPLSAQAGDMAAIVAAIPGGVEKLASIQQESLRRLGRGHQLKDDRAVASALSHPPGTVFFQNEERYEYKDGRFYLCPAFDSKTMQPLPREAWRMVYLDPRKENAAQCERELRTVLDVVTPINPPRAICKTLYQLAASVP